MAIVKATEGESVESLIRKFNKKVQQEGILTELRRREFYEKPAETRKKAKQALVRKLKYKQE